MKQLLIFEDEKIDDNILDRYAKKYKIIKLKKSDDQVELKNKIYNSIYSFDDVELQPNIKGKDVFSFNGVNHWGGLSTIFYMNYFKDLLDLAQYQKKIDSILSNSQSNTYVLSNRKNRIRMIEDIAKKNKNTPILLKDSIKVARIKNSFYNGKNFFSIIFSTVLPMFSAIFYNFWNHFTSKNEKNKYGGSKIILFPKAVTHLNDLIPIAKKLNREKKLEYVVLLPFSSFESRLINNSVCSHIVDKLKKHGIKFEYIDKSSGIGIRETLSIIKNITSFSKVIRIFPFKLKENLEKDLGIEIPQHFVTDSRAIVFSHIYYVFINILLDRYLVTRDPSLIVKFGTGRPYSQILGVLGKKKGIPVLLIPHSIIGHEGFPYKIYCDKIAVSGYIDLNSLKKSGIREEKLVLTGRPYYDRVVTFKNIQFRGEKNKRNNVNILIVSQPIDTELDHFSKSLFIKTVLSELKKFNNIDLIVKLHPMENEDNLYHQFAAEIGIRLNILKNADLYELMHTADLVITIVSNAGAEALLMGKPVISVNLSGVERPSYVAEKGAVEARNKEEVHKVIDDIVNKDRAFNSEGFINKFAYKMDGKATDRVLKLIHEMV